MNRPIFLLSLFLSCCAAMAQGTVFLYNHIPAVGLDAPVFDTDGLSLLQGYQFQVQLYAGPTADHLSPVGPAASFGLQPGYWSSWGESLDRTIPDVPPGDTAFCQVRVWSFLLGPNYEAVEAADGKHGQSSVFSVTTGGDSGGTEPPTFPAFLVGLKSFSLTGTEPTPEPTTIALLATAAALCWFARRR
jgi:hypothetical protein